MSRKTAILLFFLLSFWASFAQDLGDHRSAQFATHGTDFWFVMPRWKGHGWSDHYRNICIVAEHDCQVTISNPYFDYSETFEVKSHTTINTHLDSINFHGFPEVVSRYTDTIITDGRPDSLQPGYLPQNFGLHVTSTDTIALFLLYFSFGTQATANILPTEMLRDEYVVQSYPAENYPMIEYFDKVYTQTAFTDIVATEDNTTVDIVLNCTDWFGRPAGDTVTVTLQQGQMYHLESFLAPLADEYNGTSHSFVPHQIILNHNISDISGTHIIARDNKRIAVFEGHNNSKIPSGQRNTNLFFDQSIPIRYAGKEFVVPNLTFSDKDYLRFTGLADSTTITIIDAQRITNRGRTMTIHAYQTDWFEMDTNEGPFFITSSKPIILKSYSSTFASCTPILPTEWWNCNPIHNHTLFWTDHNHNRYYGQFFTHILTRTQDVPNMEIDGYNVSSLFHSIGGTPYSYTTIDHHSSFNSIGTHDITCSQPGYFMAIMQSNSTPHSFTSFWLQPHIQPGGCYLYVNGIPAQELNPDSLWCMYDPIHFQAWTERPADSIIWDFGDGTVQRFAYDDGQQLDYTYSSNGDYLVRRIITWRDESTEPCLAGRSAFTRTPDTMYAHINIRNHHDTTINARMCEGSYYFRGNEYYFTDTFYLTTYWTPSGCDTLWTIDFVTCPHCYFFNDTVNSDDLPHRFYGTSFGGEVENFPIHISINDTCDSIIYYTLVVIPGWGETPVDSAFILVPNIFTPSLETNNRFKIVANKFILEAQVTLYDRRGIKVAQFDGLTQEWDGTKDGHPLQQGTYIYYIRYRDTYVNGWKTLKGSVTLVR